MGKELEKTLVSPEREKPPLSHVALGCYSLTSIADPETPEGELKTYLSPQEEITALTDVLRKGLPSVFSKLEEENGRFRALGNIERFPADIQAGLQEAMLLSQDRKGITVNLAMAYSGRDEITRAVQKIVRSGYKEAEITEELISQSLDTAGQPDPDLVIRTGGRYRLSGFLPWQGVYAEIYFSDILWPDFGIEEFNKAISWHQEQTRTFGH